MFLGSLLVHIYVLKFQVYLETATLDKSYSEFT